MIRAALIVVLFLGWARAEEPKVASPPAPFVIHWITKQPGAHSVVLTGKIAEAAVRAPERAFVVQVEQQDIRSAIGLPAMNGKYAVTAGAIEFRPQFPFLAGVRYREWKLRAKLDSS